MSDPEPLRSLDADARRRILGGVTLLATDVDGTLTKGDGLDPEVVAAIARLVQAGIEVMPVSGRPSGEVLGLVRYLPGVRRGIAENGMVEIVPDTPPVLLVPAVDRDRLRAQALDLGRASGLTLRSTADDPFRVVDVAFEREHREAEVLAELAARVADAGLFATWSSVHVHVTHVRPDKGAALLRAAGVPGAAIATIGDAPNDAGLFVAGRFGVTVGTADVLRQAAFMPAMPRWVCAQAESAGFLELAGALLAAR
ncbi:MAG: HAD family phosphatase [Deltaproteobacteria bacterium]|nr:HAD family phosphatase [Deltaproteobacteria bacterium]MBK8236829.1 HAD family phosphatase [Deltaproteobacteria bacterium]MBK8719038.1 HAD family phosphatase [Deltaproteobacteria bacterium]MBP7287954.1 HAD family phosphatase [Nannocystaceae bacterium]